MALPASDNFNRADQNPLAGNWTKITSSLNLKILSNQISSIGSADSKYLWNADTFNADQYSQCRPTVFVGGQLACVRASAPNNAYVVRMATSYLDIEKYVEGVRTILGSSYSYSMNGTTDVAKISVVGTTLQRYMNGTAVGGAVTDASLSSGRAGIGTLSNPRTLDDWIGGNMAAPATGQGVLMGGGLGDDTVLMGGMR